LRKISEIKTENFGPQDSDPITKFYAINPELKEKYQIKKVKFALSNDQREELLDLSNKTNPKHYLTIKTQLETGMRVNELCNLAIDQVNFTECILHVQTRNATRYVKEFKTKTKSSNRIIPITKELSRLLKSEIKKRATGYIFESQKKGKFSKTSLIRIVNHYAKLCKSIGKNIGSHTLRRTYASYLLSKGVKIGDISKILGHASIKTTMIYLYDIVDLSSFDEVRKIVQGMNK
jgi:integrase